MKAQQEFSTSEVVRIVGVHEDTLYRNGTAYWESTHTTDERKAQEFLQNRLDEITTGNFLGPAVEENSSVGTGRGYPNQRRCGTDV